MSSERSSRGFGFVLRTAILLLCAASSAFAADLSKAVVRQKVNVVTIAPSMNAEPRAASTGAVVQDENVVRTGTESRAELEFADLTLARMGANSIFSFDAQARALTVDHGSVLFAKPSNSGRVEVRSGAITAAITGSTGFVSNRTGKAQRGHDAKSATMMGMLEGHLKGCAAWRDEKGREQNFCFNLGPGEMIVASPDRRPTVVQFDIARFMRTSPLITAFSNPLPNNAQLNRALADYNADVARGFVQARTIAVRAPAGQYGWVSAVDRNSFDVSVQSRTGSSTSPGGGFENIGGTGVIRGQLVWETMADLDLHLLLPDGQEVYYANKTVPFNNARATAMLDHDNLGGTIDLQPNKRVENIAITGTPLNGNYNFFVNSFSTSNSSDPFTLTVSNGTHTQVLTGNLPANQNSQTLTVVWPGR